MIEKSQELSKFADSLIELKDKIDFILNQIESKNRSLPQITTEEPKSEPKSMYTVHKVTTEADGQRKAWLKSKKGEIVEVKEGDYVENCGNVNSIVVSHCAVVMSPNFIFYSENS